MAQSRHFHRSVRSGRSPPELLCSSGVAAAKAEASRSPRKSQTAYRLRHGIRFTEASKDRKYGVHSIRFEVRLPKYLSLSEVEATDTRWEAIPILRLYSARALELPSRPVDIASPTRGS